MPTVNVSLVFLDLVLVVEFSLATNVTHQFQSIRVVLTSSFVLFQIGCCLEDFSTVFELALLILHSTLRVENSQMLLVAFLCTELSSTALLFTFYLFLLVCLLVHVVSIF